MNNYELISQIGKGRCAIACITAPAFAHADPSHPPLGPQLWQGLHGEGIAQGWRQPRVQPPLPGCCGPHACMLGATCTPLRQCGRGRMSLGRRLRPRCMHREPVLQAWIAERVLLAHAFRRGTTSTMSSTSSRCARPHLLRVL
jgi:hypothetical protein